MRSTSGHWRMNSRYSVGVQKPITRSTPARLYQERSKKHDFAGRRQVLDVALEIPLRALALGRLLQRDDARAARVQVLHEALDRAALAGRVAPLEQHDDLLAGLLDPVLRLQQLRLQRQHALEIGLLLDLGAVGIVAGLEGAADRVGVAARVRLDAERGFSALSAFGGLGRLQRLLGLRRLRRLLGLLRLLGRRFGLVRRRASAGGATKAAGRSPIRALRALALIGRSPARSASSASSSAVLTSSLRMAAKPLSFDPSIAMAYL